MALLKIHGGYPLRGSVRVQGMKNAALPALAATILTEEDVVLHNVPRIEDVLRMIEILRKMGGELEWTGQNSLKVSTKEIDPGRMDQILISRLRGSVLLIGSILARFKEVSITEPGGCKIGARSIKTHLEAFRALGCRIEIKQNSSKAKGVISYRDIYQFKAAQMKAGEIILDEFSVTATENIILAAALLKGETTIKMAAAEPQIQDLCLLLRKMGAEIRGIGTHTLVIRGRDRLQGTSHDLPPDHLEVGTLLILGASTKSRIKIWPVAVEHLEFFFKKCRDFGMNFSLEPSSSHKRLKNLIVRSSYNLKATRVQTLPFPGFPTDLQAPISVLATQALGTTNIYETLYEGRFRHLEELNKMGANAVVSDPHMALVTGPTPLFGREIETLDARAGATLLIAGLVASGITILHDVYQLDRGYERLDERLQELGAKIERS